MTAVECLDNSLAPVHTIMEKYLTLFAQYNSALFLCPNLDFACIIDFLGLPLVYE